MECDAYNCYAGWDDSESDSILLERYVAESRVAIAGSSGAPYGRSGSMGFRDRVTECRRCSVGRDVQICASAATRLIPGTERAAAHR